MTTAKGAALAAISCGATASPEPDLVRAVALAFEVLHARYGAKFARLYEDIAARDVWVRDLAAEGVTAQDIDAALARCRRDEWPPTCPQFIAYCTPTAEEHGLPAPRAAYMAALRGDWKLHPIVYHVATQIGTWELRHEPEAKGWPRWEALYNQAVREYHRGRSFTMPEIRTPQIPTTLQTDIISPQEAMRRCWEILL